MLATDQNAKSQLAQSFYPSEGRKVNNGIEMVVQVLNNTTTLRGTGPFISRKGIFGVEVRG